MSYCSQEKFWFSMLGIVVCTLCLLAVMGVWHAIKMPPQTDIQKARNAFITNCSNSQQNGWGSSNNAVPNTGSTNPKEWTCTFAK